MCTGLVPEGLRHFEALEVHAGLQGRAEWLPPRGEKDSGRRMPAEPAVVVDRIVVALDARGELDALGEWGEAVVTV